MELLLFLLCRTERHKSRSTILVFIIVVLTQGVMYSQSSLFWPKSPQKPPQNVYWYSWVCLSPSTADLEPGGPAAGPLGPEGRHSDGGQLWYLCGLEVRSHDRKLHLLCPRQPIGIEKVSTSAEEWGVSLRNWRPIPFEPRIPWTFIPRLRDAIPTSMLTSAIQVIS